jgi:hypothetical protein
MNFLILIYRPFSTKIQIDRWECPIHHQRSLGPSHLFPLEFQSSEHGISETAQETTRIPGESETQ